MALGTPVAGTVAYTISTGDNINAPYPTGITAGDVLVLFVAQKPAVANGGVINTPAGWTERDALFGAGGYGTTLGADTGNTNMKVFTKDVVTGSETGNLLTTVTGNGIAWGFIVLIPAGSGAISYGTADGQRTTTPTSPLSITLTNGTNPTNFQAGDLALWAMCIPTDATTPSQFSVQSVTATGATFGTAVELNEPDSQANNDIGGYSAYAFVTAGSSTTAPTVTTSIAGTLTNVRGPVLLIRVREAAPPAQGLTQSSRVENNESFSSATVTAENSLSPARLENAETFYSATVTRGPVGLSPDRYNNSSSFYAATVSQTGGDQNLAPSRYSNANSFYSATVKQTLTAGRLNNVSTVYAPTASAKRTLTPPRYQNTNSFYAATVTARKTISPSLYSNGDTFYSPAISVTVRPARYDNSSSFYSATVTSGAGLVVPPRLDNSNSFYAASVTAKRTLLASMLPSGSAIYPASLTISATVVSPQRLTNSSSFYAPQVIPGARSLNPQRLTNASTFYGPTVGQSITLRPARLNGTSTVRQATVTVGPVTLSPQRLQNQNTFGAARVSSPIRLDRIASTNQFFSYAVGYRLKPARVSSGNQFFSPTTSTIKSLTAVLTQNNQTFYALLARSNYPLAAPRISNTQSFGGAGLSVGPVIPPASSIDTELSYSDLTSSAEWSVPVARTEVSLLSAAIGYVSLGAQTAYASLTATFDYAALKTSAILGEFLITRAFSDAVNLLESTFLFYNKGVVESLTGTDTVTVSLSRVRTEQTVATDVRYNVFSKLRDDPVAASDAKIMSVSRVIFDSTYATDDLNGASADDNQVIQFVKTRNNVATALDTIQIVSSFSRTYSEQSIASDLAQKTQTKSPSDAAVTTDSGFVTSQSYAVDYFAQDYVGSYRTF